MTAPTNLPAVLSKGVAGSRPAASAVAGGALYFATDTGVISQSDGVSTWTTFLTVPVSAMTNPLTTTGDIIYSSSGTTAARLAIGSATTVLHGGTTPGYAAVVEGDLSTSDITTANATTAKHGFAPKYPNDATKYLDGTGAYTVPAGGSTPTYVGCKAYSDATQAINSTIGAFTFNQEEWDTDGFHESVTNPSRFTIPSGKGGKYLVQGGAFASGNTDWIACYVNGSIVRGTITFARAASSYFSGSWIVNVAAGDYIEIEVSTTTSVNFGHATLVDAQKWGSVTWLGA